MDAPIATLVIADRTSIDFDEARAVIDGFDDRVLAQALMAGLAGDAYTETSPTASRGEPGDLDLLEMRAILHADLRAVEYAGETVPPVLGEWQIENKELTLVATEDLRGEATASEIAAFDLVRRAEALGHIPSAECHF